MSYAVPRCNESNDWFQISKFIPEHPSNSAASPYRSVLRSLILQACNLWHKSQKYILLARPAKNPMANFEWIVPSKRCRWTRVWADLIEVYKMINGSSLLVRSLKPSLNLIYSAEREDTCLVEQELIMEMRYPNVTWRIILPVYLFTTELRHICIVP